MYTIAQLDSPRPTLYRGGPAGMFGGVCAGVAYRFDIPIFLVRTLFIFGATLGIGFLVYGVIWAFAKPFPYRWLNPTKRWRLLRFIAICSSPIILMVLGMEGMPLVQSLFFVGGLLSGLMFLGSTESSEAYDMLEDDEPSALLVDDHTDHSTIVRSIGAPPRLAGVCRSWAEYSGLNVTLTRFLTIFASIATFPIIPLIYAVCILAIPRSKRMGEEVFVIE